MSTSVPTLSRSMSACQKTVLCIAVLACTVGSARAEDHLWSSAGGGSFNYWLNWVPNWVPQDDDRAIFELGMDPAYEVTFYESVTNDECLFRNDKVILDLGGFTYTLDHSGFALTVGEDAGQVAEVVFYNGGAIDTTVAHIGLWDDSSGTLDLESGVLLDVSDHLLVGNDGDGVMTIHDGASVTTEFAALGGHDFGNVGVLYVDGSNAEFTVNETLRVGVEGHGYLHVQNNATAHSRNGYIGDWSTGYGEIHIRNGAKLVFTDWLATGLGTGHLWVAQSGKLELPNLTIGGESGGDGHADLLHEGSRIDASGYIFVGDYTHGTMNVSLQAAMTTDTLLVGAGETGEGELTVSDAGTTVTVQNNLVSGLYGIGVVNITNGAHVRTTEPGGWIFVGQTSGCDGYLLVDGSTLTAESAPLVVGESGYGVMDVFGGSEVHTSGELFLGWHANSFGQLTISGENSKYISDSGYPARIGDEGEAALLIEYGGHFAKPGACFIGIKDTGIGSVALFGDQATFMCEQLSVGEYGLGTFNINDGRVALGDINLADVPAGEMHMAGYYTQLTGTGTVTGDVVNIDAKVMPGGDEAATLTGVLTIDGNYTQQDARLTIKLKGTTAGDEYSRLHVAGTANLDGELHIELIDGFEPQPGDEFVVLTASAVHNTFVTVTGLMAYVITYNADNVTITIPPTTVGDMDCDGTYGYLSFGDINPFVLFLSNFSAWQATYPGCDPRNGDINGDGTYGQGSFGDVNPFVALLSGS